MDVGRTIAEGVCILKPDCVQDGSRRGFGDQFFPAVLLGAERGASRRTREAVQAGLVACTVSEFVKQG